MPSLHHHHDAVDLRSDTVTRPTPQMLEAMACAPLGDDGLDGDPTVRALEETVAQRFGKAAGLFVASGTMGNLVAVLAHGRMPGEVLAEDRKSTRLNSSHLVISYAVFCLKKKKNS